MYLRKSRTHLASKFLLGNPEQWRVEGRVGGRGGGNLVNMLGVFLTNARVEMLKVSVPRFSSLSRFYCLNFLKKRGKIPFLSLLDFH